MRELLFAIPLVIMSAGYAYGDDAYCGYVKCVGDECGCALKQNGWVEESRCKGHNWAYLITKGDQIKRCTGVNARGGALESPCEDFRGDVEAFKKYAAAGKCYGDVETQEIN